MTTLDDIVKTHDRLCDLQIYKNQKYGDSALNPICAFSKLDAIDGLKVRLDDKLSRVVNSDELRKNDIADIIGYLVLICINQGWDDFEEFKD